MSAQDTIHVKSSMVPRWGNPLILAQQFAVGAVDGPDEYAFGVVDELTVDKRGRMYVYDSKDHQIRAYDPNGKFLRNIGRSGDGPGEYRWVTGMAVAEDSLLVVVDISNARVTYFAPGGRVVRSFQDARATATSSHRLVIDREGLVYIDGAGASASGSEIAPGSKNQHGRKILRVRADGKHVDVLVMPVGLSLPRSFRMQTADGGNINFNATSEGASLRSGGYVFGHGNEFRLMVVPSKGPVRIIERDWKPVPLTSGERANWIAIGDQFAKQGGPTHYDIPTVKPVFRRILTDNDSRIWVSMYAPASKIALPPRDKPDPVPQLAWQQRAVYEVYSDQGEYLAHVELPPRTQMLAAQGNRLWALSKGPDNEDVIKVYTMSGVR